jgi:hypothetical protein
VAALRREARQSAPTNPALALLGEIYREPKQFPHLGHFRLGPNMFSKIKLDWLIFAAPSASRPESLIGHGVLTRIHWNGDITDLPNGWQGSVRLAYEQLRQSVRCNTLVGLFVRIEPDHRGQGWSEKAISAMKDLARRLRAEHLIIPLRLPSAYLREYVTYPIERLAGIRRGDGQVLDHWLRLHIRLGGQIVGCSDTSHQHAMTLDDLYAHFVLDRVRTTGYYEATFRDDYYRVFVDIERKYALINEPCVWVQHAVEMPMAKEAP